MPDPKTRKIAVLPLGATEQHGPHLPAETDTLIAEAVMKRTLDHLPADFPLRRLPAEPVGYSPEHIDLGRTKSLDFDEAVRRWIDIGRQQNEAGIRKFVMLNAHGGNSPLMTVVATELRVRFSMLAVATSWTRFGTPVGLVPANEAAIGIHGGLVETSVMLAISPELVDMEKAEDFPSAQTRYASDLPTFGPTVSHAFGWKMNDLNTKGVAGNAKAATAELGERLLDHAAAGFAELLHDVERFDIAALN